MAASRPTAVAVPIDGFSVCSIAWPPSCTSSCGDRAPSGDRDHAFDRRRRAGRSRAGRSSTVANATWPSRETRVRPGGEYGLTTPLTWGSRAICASTGATRARTAGSVTLPRARVEDDLVGVSRLRREVALEQVDRALGLGARSARSCCCSWCRPRSRRANAPTSATIQPSSTTRRWRAAQPPSRATTPDRSSGAMTPGGRSVPWSTCRPMVSPKSEHAPGLDGRRALRRRCPR